MEQVPWTRIVPNDIVRGGDGHDWTVTGRNGMTFILERKGAKPFVKVMSGSVSRVSGAEVEVREVVARVEDLLGGEVIQREEEGLPPACPAEFVHVGALMAHLYMLHGVRYDGVKEEPTLTELEKMHEDAHAERNDGYIHHHHRQDVLAINGEEF